MAESGFSSGSENEELDLEVLSGYVKTVYKAFKKKVASTPNGLHASPEYLHEPMESPASEPFYRVVSHAAKALKLDFAPFEPVKPTLALIAPGTERVLLPLDETIVKQCQAVWLKPASATPVHKTMDRKYRVPRDSLIHCFSHPQVDSVVVKAASFGRIDSATDFPLPDIESKVMDSIGKRTYHSGGLSLRQANLSLVLARYNKHLWSQLPDLLESLPEDLEDKAREIQKEALAAADVNIEIAKDQADVAARVMANGIVLRRRAWLRVTQFAYAFQTILLDQPFDGINLFGPSAEELIKNRSKSPGFASKSPNTGKNAAAKSPGSFAAKAASFPAIAKSPAASRGAKPTGATKAAATKSPATTAAKSPAAGAAKSTGTTAPKRKRRRRNPPAEQQ